MSEQVERRLIELLGKPTFDPYGNPIPGLDELGVTPADDEAVVSLVEVVSTEPATLRLVRVGEPLQVDVELLAQLEELEIRPGARVTARREESVLVLGAEGNGTELELGDDLAKHLFVAAS